MERGLRPSPGAAELCWLLPAGPQRFSSHPGVERKGKINSWEGWEASLKQSLGKSGSSSEGAQQPAGHSSGGKAECRAPNQGPPMQIHPSPVSLSHSPSPTSTFYQPGMNLIITYIQVLQQLSR